MCCQGVLPFEGVRDVAGFIRTAHQLGLLVLLRPGPYICAGLCVCLCVFWGAVVGVGGIRRGPGHTTLAVHVYVTQLVGPGWDVKSAGWHLL